MGLRSEIERALDEMQRRTLRSKENMICFCCGNAGDQVGHIYGRRHRHTRWDTHEQGNCHILCSDCHRADTDHKLDPSYKDIFEDRFGHEALLEIRTRSKLEDFQLNVELLRRLAEITMEHSKVLGLPNLKAEHLRFVPDFVLELLRPTDD